MSTKKTQPAPPTHWRVTKKGERAGIGYQAGTVVPATDLAPHTGAMHVRGLITPVAPPPAPPPVPEPEVAPDAEPGAEPAAE